MSTSQDNLTGTAHPLCIYCTSRAWRNCAYCDEPYCETHQATSFAWYPMNKQEAICERCYWTRTSWGLRILVGGGALIALVPLLLTENFWVALATLVGGVIGTALMTGLGKLGPDPRGK